MPHRPATRALVTAAVLAGLLTACTSGGAGTAATHDPAARDGATSGPTPTDPAADAIRTSGLALTVNGVVVDAATASTITPGPRTDPDGSVHLRLLLQPDGTATTGSVTAGPTPTAGDPPAPGPLAWLTGPAGSTVSVLEDGSAVVSAADGGFLVGLTAPTPSARFTVVGTPAAVLRVDRIASNGLAPTAPTGPVTTWLSGSAVLTATWGVAEGGRSLEIAPSEWARTGTLAAQQGLWSQLVAQHPDANSPTMHEQLLCHVLGAAGKSTWHIEPWRPQVDALTMLRTRCNPTTADATSSTPTATPAG